MSSLFKVDAPVPDPVIEEKQKEQEAKLEQAEKEKRTAMAATQRARRWGGQRALLSQIRGGYAEESTLGKGGM